ncbi:chemotaxis protein CheA [Shewanella sedimentimangrovi]|uniref:Chemotaxis protein CheA n=1 Tax=Shewanella sedimentimangrovi TaxID=2814293 RepID=A0ABX7R047_9GAMM|nr:chemotaxis protein CheA [Shewanella sedimentimangrovi]QSX37152.1 chemotaxis protein CheA [Shewanella sedimentimangrovi]
MDIDLSQFSQVFFEESIEGLAVMESELLKLDIAAPDPETINTIFRAAHSIKGGSATFGFTAVANFTHLLETLLDQIRDGQRQMTAEHVDLLLASVDLLRGMIDALMNKGDYDNDKAQQLQQRLSKLLAEEAKSPTKQVDAWQPADEQPNGWQIEFVAGVDILRCGNDPQLMFAELREKGELNVRLQASQLPPWHDFDPESCYLSWQLTLHANVPLDEVKEVFEWVEDECQIRYQPLFDAEPTTEDPIVEDMAVDKPHVKAPDLKSVPQNKGNESSSIRVSTEKIDMLINMVGELVITQAMLGQIGRQDEIGPESMLLLQQGLEQLASHTRDLQESVMQIRMLPISFAFNRFPRLVRDIGQQLNKKVELVLKGEDTELDKTVLEKIVDPMVHLVRNSLDHGLESPETRRKFGKAETGTITLNAFHQGGNIVIEITDDGAGLNTAKILAKAREKGLVGADEELSDEAIHQLIFKPGFSTADAVSDLSGRGVGMDVVKRNIHELNGSIELSSQPGKGSRITIRLPLTLAILDGQLVRIGRHIYVVPLVSIYESLQVAPSRINRLSEDQELIRLRDEYLPVVKVHQVFNHDAEAREIKDGLVMVVDNSNEKVGLLVDELLAQQQVVIKSLEDNYTRIPGISGATILGDGTVALIIDVAGLVNLAGLRNGKEHAA